MILRCMVVISLGFVIQSCSDQKKEAKINLKQPETIELAIYRESSGSQFTATQTWTHLKNGDAAKLVQWINAKVGWKSCLATYAPAKVFRSGVFNLNILPSQSAVLNHSNDQGKWRQVCVELNADDVDFFRSLPKEN
jgi:hypothetical protein